ncbi:MAG: transaldolase [Lachnospiraceae bacterium]|nr:transaldolase [Lachnospiraceae bacterium]
MTLQDLRVDIYADGADIAAMKKRYEEGYVKGFTTNPTLMRKAGVSDYLKFAGEAVKAIPDLPVSFEVFSDDFDTMEREAKVLSSLGKNVFVKIPVTNTKGESSVELVRRLSEQGIQLNVTAVFTIPQVRRIVDALVAGQSNIVSIFAGRVSNAGVDPEPVMREAAEICHAKAGTRLLWASTRELFNIIQADRTGTDIITVTDGLLSQLDTLGKDLEQYSRETVEMFYRDAQALGFHII